MINIFKQIKQLKMTKQELSAVKEEKDKMLEAIHRLNTANKEQTNIIAQLKIDLNNAINRVRDISEQLNMIHARQQATERFNDNDKNY